MLKKSVFTMVFIILALSLGKSYGDVNNVLTNPGFESQTTGWSAFGGSFTTVTSSPSPHGGSRSGRAYSRTATWNGILQSVLGKMTVGQTYTVSGWVRTASPSATIMLTFAKTDGGGNSWAQGAIGAANNTSWTYISGSYTLTANGTITTLNFYVESSDLNDVYLDDANVVQQMPPDANATADVNFGAVFQQIEGFGAAIYDGSSELTSRSYRNEVYDLMFRDLGIDVVRIRNCYTFDSGFLSATGTVIKEANDRAIAMGRPLPKIEMVPWSPPASLKSNGNVNGGGTLAGGPSAYNYAGLGTWWADSLTASNGWGSVGIHPDYISIQNEPDIETSYDSCKYLPTQSTSFAGYDQAFEAVYNEIHSRMGSNAPKMIGPEATGIGAAQGYINAFINQDHAYAYSFHLYDQGSDGWNNPDNLLSAMETFYATNGYKPLIMTEFVHLDWTPDFDDAWKLAWHIHNSLYHLGVTSYYHWTLIRATGTGGLINITSTSSYIVRDMYWFFKHYTYYTDPNWYVLDCTTNPSDNLRMSAFKDPNNNKLTVVVLNKSTTTDVNLTLTLHGFTSPSNWLTNEVYRSSSTEHWAYLGTFDPNHVLTIPAQSIITIHIASFQTCADVQNNNHGLNSDLNGDCYIDFDDLYTLASFWLRQDCSTENNNCDGADFVPRDGVVDFFDFSDFADQWMTCNDPTNPNCTQNW